MHTPPWTRVPARGDRPGRFALRAVVLGVLFLLPVPALATPGAPTGLSAASPTRAKPLLTWTAPTVVGAGIAGYNVYRGATKLTASPIAATSYTDANAAGNSTLSYTVTAVEVGNVEGPASVAATVVYDTTAPAAPTALTGSTPTNAAPVLSWTAGAADNLSGLRYYDVYRGTTLIGTTTATTYTDTGLVTFGSFSYQVKAEDNAGNQSAAISKSILFDNVAPATPAGFNPVPAQRTKPTLSWTAATDTGGAGIDHYEVFRGAIDAGPSTTTSFIDTAVTTEATYTYTVVAVDKAGNVGPPTAAHTVTYDVTVPGIPTSFAAMASPTGAKPAFAWIAPTDPGASASGVVSYRIYRNGTLAATAAGATGSDSSVTTDGTYSYYVTAVDAAGNESAPSAIVNVLYDKTPPPVPVNLAAAATPTPAKPILSWASGGADALSGFRRYDVYRSGVLVGQPTTAAFTDSALSTSGSQSYTVKAEDNAGNLSAATAALVVIYDAAAPPAPTNLIAPAATSTKPTLKWTAPTDLGGSGIAGYRIYRDGSLLGTATTASYSETSTTYPDGPYAYAVSAVDNAGNEGPRTATATVVYDTTAPAAPGDPTTTATVSPVTSTPVTKLKPSITWTAASDPGGSGIATYTVFRNGTQVGTATGTSFIDSGLATNGSYDYTVRATDAAGNASATTAALTIAYDTTAPPAPAGLTAPTPTGHFPALTWSSGGPDGLSGFLRYDVYRGSTLLASVSGTTYTDAVAPSGSSSYTVKAVDYAGNVSSASTAFAVVFDTTPPNPPTNLQAPSPTRLPALTWTAPTDVSGIDHYDVYRDGSAIGAATGTSFTDSPAPAEGTHTYAVLAVDKAGNVGLQTAPKTVTIDTTPPPTPTGLTGPSPSSTKPVLSWTSGGADAGAGFKSYEVFRNGVLMGSPTGSSFSDSTLTTNGSYTYTVRALDNAGNESASSSAVAIVWDSTPPPTPSGLNGPAIVTGAPHLAWFSGGPDGLSGFDHYDVYRATTLVGQTTSTTFDDAAVNADGTYSYTVRAVDAAGNSSVPSTPLAVLRDTTPPAPPTVTAAATPTRLHPALTWTAATDGSGSGVTAYEVSRDGVVLGTTGSRSYVDDDVLADGVYVYTVVAIDAAGNRSSSSAPAAIRLDTVAPPAPTALGGATPTNAPSISFAESTDSGTGGSGVAGYDLYRNGVRVAQGIAPPLADAGVLLDDAYAYTVTAVDGAGNESVASDPLPVVVDRTAPPRPTSLTLQTPAASPNRPALAWNSGGPDALSGFDHYAVYRDGLLVGTPTTGAFSDDALAVNGSYSYTVRAVDAAGNASVASPAVSAIWDTSPPTQPAALTIPSPTPRPALTWTASTDAGGSGIDHYVILRDGVPVATSRTPAYTDADNAVSEGAHAYAVQAVDGAGNVSGVTDGVMASIDRTPPTVVPGLAGASPVARPVLTWTAASDPGPTASGISRYEVYRGSTLAGETPGLTFRDDAVNLDGDYVYTVRALDAAGNLGPAQDTGVTIRFDRTPPPTPTRLTAPTPTPDVPRLAWTSGGSDNLAGFDRYEVYRDGTLAGQTTQPTFADTELSAQGPHAYVVKAVDAAGNASAPSTTLTVVYDATAPPTPTGLTIPSPTNLPQLTWDAGADDDTGASGIDHYDVYRDGTVVGRATTTAFSDSSVLANGSYAYAITAVDRAGNESLSSRTVIIRYDGTAPPAPTDLSGVSPTRVPVMTWRGVSDAATGGSAITTYRIYRDGAFVGETTGTSFTDPGVGASGHHLYAVYALDAAGNLGAASSTRDIVVDLQGPQLDDISVPGTRIMGQAVAFSVAPHDQFAAVRGPAHWDFGDGSATGNNVTHVYGAPGRYTITISATDVLGNQTVVANRAITINEPPGGIPPSYLKLSRLGNVRRGTLKRARGRIYLIVSIDRSANLEFVLLKEGAVVSDVIRRVPSGGARLFVTIPKSEWAPGHVQISVRTLDGGRSGTRRFKIIR